MNTNSYLEKFRAITDGIDAGVLLKNGLALKVGIWLDSAVIKVQKPSWTNSPPEPLSFQQSIFFSIWVNEDTLKKNRLYYNIHALKLRALNAYKIKSTEFANAFRLRFSAVKDFWPNVSTGFGPLTLMEGWVALAAAPIEHTIPKLVHQFIDIAHIIDELLAERKSISKE